MKNALIAAVLLSSLGSANAAPVLTGAGSMFSVSSLRFSPKGDKLAYTLCSNVTEASGAHVKRCNLFVSSKSAWKKGLPSSYIASEVNNFAWSPDGQLLAFLRNCGHDECLSIANGIKVRNYGLATGKTLEWLTPDSIVIAEAIGTPEVSTGASKNKKVRVFHGSKARASALNAIQAKLILVTISGGKREVIDANVPMFLWSPFVAVSPDGQSIAYTVARRFGAGRLVIVDIKVWRRGLKPVVVARKMTQRTLNGDLTWSPNGRKLAWCGVAELHARQVDKIFIYDLKNRKLTIPKLPDSMKPCPSWGLFQEDLPDLVWVNDNYVLISSDDYVRNLADDRRATAIYQLDVMHGNISKVYLGSRDEEVYIVGPVSNLSSSMKSLFLLIRPGAGGNASLIKWSSQAGSKALQVDIPGGISTLVMDLSKGYDEFAYVDHIIDSIPAVIVDNFSSGKKYNIRIAPGVGSARSVTWLHYFVGGQQRTAALISPTTTTKDSRLIIAVYPTLRSTDLLGFADVEPFPGLSYWLTRGDFVLYPDMHVRSGRARDDIVEDVTSAMQAFAKFKSRNNIKACGHYVFGHSAGALAVYDVITSDIALDGAVATDGFSSWDAFFGEGTRVASSLRPYGPPLAEYSSIGPTGTPWTNPEGYRSASPYYDFDKVTVPLLIGHGTKDPLDVYHAVAAFISLESLGKDVTLALADGGGHSPSNWSAGQQKAFLQAVNRFIADHTPKRCKSLGEVK